MLQGLPLDEGLRSTAQREPQYFGFIKLTTDF
jgi:hypothetical protein